MTDPLIAEILANPEDDHARLVWGDRQGGERGELVALQCSIARGTSNAQQRQRARELIATHGWAWSGLEGIADAVQFRRGFVDAVSSSATSFVENDIFERAPLLEAATFSGFTQQWNMVTDVRTGPDPMVPLCSLFEHPAYRRLRGAAFTGLGIATERDSPYAPHGYIDQSTRGIELALQLGAFEQLTALGIAVNAESMALIGRAWTQIERLEVPDVRAIDFSALPSLRALAIERIHDVSPLPVGLVELRAGFFEDFQLEALAAHPVAQTIEHLVLDHLKLRDQPQLFARFPALRSLYLSDLWLGHGAYSVTMRDIAKKLAATPLPNLRELHISGPVLSEEGLVAIANAFGPQLEVLEIGRPSDKITVAGELHVSTRPSRWLIHSHRESGWSATLSA